LKSVSDEGENRIKPIERQPDSSGLPD
jgi:hypothetical protein